MNFIRNIAIFIKVTILIQFNYKHGILLTMNTDTVLTIMHHVRVFLFI